MPRRTAPTAPAALRSCCTSIASGNPSGLAARDHGRKRGLRVNRTMRWSRTCAMAYGPVAGGRGPVPGAAVPGAIADADGSASLTGRSGSGAVRWMVTVPARSSATTPRERSHAFGHAAAPAMREKKPGAGELSVRSERSRPRRMSLGRTGAPLA
jgi:hypothetical protein